MVKSFRSSENEWNSKIKLFFRLFRATELWGANACHILDWEKNEARSMKLELKVIAKYPLRRNEIHLYLGITSSRYYFHHFAVINIHTVQMCRRQINSQRACLWNALTLFAQNSCHAKDRNKVREIGREREKKSKWNFFLVRGIATV